MTPPSCIEIDLGQLDANLSAWQSVLADGSQVCAVVKADAYGLGAVPVAQRLASHGVKLLAVYNMNQATQLAQAGVNADLLVLMPVDTLDRTDVLYRWAVSGRLHMTVHNADQLGAIESIGLKFGSPMPVHIEIDTGMSRTGMSPEEAEQLIKSLPSRRYVRLAGVFTHPARADDSVVFTERQYDQFDRVIQNCREVIKPNVLIHFANTHAAARETRYHGSMVRLGLGLFGYGLDDLVGPPVLNTLPAIEPIVRWPSHIVHEHDVPANVPVG